MTALQFPCTLFKTQNRMDDYSAKDMRCGDLTAEQLKSNYGLVDISTRANPYTLTKVTPFTQPQSMFYGSRGEGEKISRPQCANILFDELRDLSRLFSVYGPYKHLIKRMITHMQNGNGKPFSSIHLDNALKAHIVNDETENSTLSKIKYALNENINWQTGIYPVTGKNEFQKAILEGKLPKFDRFQDNFNGMGITVHDTWATEITIKNLQIDNNHYQAVLHYKVQDHFGLDVNDISKFRFNQFRFFRIWFVLQRYDKFNFKPFMTNMETTIEITGVRN